VLYLIILLLHATLLHFYDARHSSSQSYFCVNPAMETDGLSNRPSVRLGNGGFGVNLNGSLPPGAISPEIVG